jgi:hypothetical protein
MNSHHSHCCECSELIALDCLVPVSRRRVPRLTRLPTVLIWDLETVPDLEGFARTKSAPQMETAQPRATTSASISIIQLSVPEPCSLNDLQTAGQSLWLERRLLRIGLKKN